MSNAELRPWSISPILTCRLFVLPHSRACAELPATGRSQHDAMNRSWIFIFDARTAAPH